MKIKAIETNPHESLIYLDRYVNDGSPSGFTEVNKTSSKTDTFSLNRSFKLLSLVSDENNFKIYGSLKEKIPLAHNQFFIHPDMINHSDLYGCTLEVNKSFEVSPTSSFRTVKIISENNSDYVKLHYDGKLGRIYRKLNPIRAIAGVEISNIVKEGITRNLLSDFISIYEEPFAKIFINPKMTNCSEPWGMVWRNSKPSGIRIKNVKYIIPLFSFWSKDRQSKQDDSFGTQLFNIWGTVAIDKSLKQVLMPTLDAYFELLVNFGLQNEYNAQNILIGFDQDWNAITIILKDMMGIEKDLELRKSLGLSTIFDSTPYKVISASDPLYQKRHSFAFDFKVCTYVIEPLIELAVENKLTTKEQLIDAMKQRTSYWLKKLPSDYFPPDIWFSHDNIDISVTENRVYIENKYPLLRN
ncbi:MAG: hypothetical protein A2X08_07390 [Bacteroidetes bacterium GWA2_32_17]|nr:MAG: hypothetical protein A2X08_07390 [Bacteroidetes bacterium GWA2_32_17]